ncbi:MAG: haloacid dehalogenase type II [Devosia sp.]
MKLAAILFDAYGTLLDVLSVSDLAEQLLPGSSVALSRLWRDKQLQYTWLRTRSDRYEDFAQVTADALDYALRSLGLSLSGPDRARLLSQYEHLTAFADAAPALEALRASTGPALAVLSNGTPALLEAAFTNAGLRQHFAALLSVDAARRFKPSPAAYQTAADHFGAAPSELLLVSSNGWDVAGAASFGFRTFWVNRAGAPVERLGVEPDGIGKSLHDLQGWLASDD